MAGLMHLVVHNYNEMLQSKKDPMVDSWFLMSSPMPVLLILVFYLYFVLKLGPQLMATRKAFNLQRILVAYNFYQVIFSLWLSSMPFRVGAWSYIFKNFCHPVEYHRNPFSVAISNGAWWYFFSKMIELLDTVFFVLRKKQNQVTFLHVYHHTITALFSWGYLKFLPGEQGLVIGFLNSLVHVVMYFYYMMAAMGPKYQKYLWWKKYMTWIQLAQFCIMLTYLLCLLAYDCKFPKALTFFFISNVIIFLYLFSDFYRKAYKKKEKLG
ncbi:elongation of very long chain fatty acids protein AAEL008004 [Cryptotermes secundus]|uniref:elongation of very long chain fatty acids protein AAEL008004 n=1 Tax=Cryptotermes secundus TaxID=105785 RepID=UPI000CD7AF7D|nr:elongation of very long chain fatty acids protein AAEL008004 [Cryptotermes secundus]XP_033609854.1 elongation of very long chain fatty acids protein AAEL008004 [Cryptotermes secundus]